MSEYHRDDSKHRAYEAGQNAKSKREPMQQHSGWGYPAGMYYYWFCLGWRGRPFVSLTPPPPRDIWGSVKSDRLPSEYARQKAIVSAERIKGDKKLGVLAVLFAFARYIDTVE